ncbi:hypothetical protein ABIB48_002724 [Arthrobacter sp. UYCu511]|uniref:hypothetical protein n=1 Tax=Arthrobacter sp. UYCu511 TaxID=3156337 RepID=UPI0033985BF9
MDAFLKELDGGKCVDACFFGKLDGVLVVDHGYNISALGKKQSSMGNQHHLTTMLTGQAHAAWRIAFQPVPVSCEVTDGAHMRIFPVMFFRQFR